MSDYVQQVALYESKSVIRLGLRNTGVYEQKLAISGPAILSSVSYMSGSGSVLVEYFDYVSDQSSLAGAHSSVSSVGVNKQKITNIHDKPFVRCTVVGSVQFEVYITVTDQVTDFSSTDGADANLSSDTGSPVLTYDETEDKYYFLRSEQGVISANATLVENLRQRILKDPLLERTFSWTDFGTKNQRIASITYETVNETSSLLRTFVYTLVGTRYRLDTDTWAVI